MMRKNQKGFTLVELIIAVAILAIVTLAVCGFIVVGSKSYTSANTDIMLQQEAQLALNQISDVIIDTTDSITYGVGTGSDLQIVLKDSEYGGEATDKCLVVINRNDAESNNRNISYWFYWNKDDETIYFKELPAVNPSMDDDEIYDVVKDEIEHAENGRAILAEHVTDLNIDISQFEENRVVMIAMTLQNGNREYSTSNNVTVRNRIALNVIDIDPMKRVDEFRIANVASVILEPGDQYTFKPDVDTTSSDKELTWELVGGPAGGTSISTNGNECTVTVGISERREEFALRVSRKNEEYKDQNKRIAMTVYVEVKRANRVGLEAEGSVAKVQPGETITITGSAVGWHLGDRDKSEINGCDTADLLKDYDLEDWTVGAGFTVVSSDEKSATIKVGDTVTEGQKIVVEATSSISVSRSMSYDSADDTNPSKPGVQGTIELTVEGVSEPSIKGDAPMSSGYKFGIDNDDTGQTPMFHDYMYDDLPIYAGNAVVCVRVREMGETDINKDQVILYWSSGRNIRFYPDMFGLELNRSYEFYMQIIVPYRKMGSASAINEDQWESDDQIIAEYYSHLDPSTGKYVNDTEDGYYASGLYYGILTPPRLSLRVSGGGVYPNSEDFYEFYSLSTKAEKAMGEISIEENGLLNVMKNTASDGGMVKFTVYKEEGGTRTRICGYNSGTMQYDSYTFADGLFTMQVNNLGNPTGNPFIKRDINHSNPAKGAGTYYIVPGYEYANEHTALKLSATYHFIDKKNIRGDYAKHYYEQEDCTIRWKVVDSTLNLQLPSENNEERWTYFPVPSDAAFPFERKLTDLQTATWPVNNWEQIKKYTKSGEDKGTWKNSVKVDCEYDSENDKYTIWLYEETGRNGATYKRKVFCWYTCKSKDSEWTPGSLMESNDEVTIKTNIDYTKDNHNWSAYFPLPGEAGFPFSLSSVTSSKTQTLEKYSLTGYNKDDNFKRNTHVMTAECSLDGSDFVLTLKDVVINGSGHKKTTTIYGQWKCGAGGKKWDVVDGAAGVYPEAVWGPIIEFRIGEYDYSYKKAEFPLPGQDGFPSFAGNTYTETKTISYYKANDTYGDDGVQGSITVTVVYTGKSDGTYTVELKNEESINNGTQIKVTTYGVWTSSADRWNRDPNQDFKVTYKKVWDTLVYFTYSEVQYMIELPLPGSNNYKNYAIYRRDDVNGENRVYSLPLYLQFNQSGETYTVELIKNNVWPNETIAKWTCPSGGSSWTQIQ